MKFLSPVVRVLQTYRTISLRPMRSGPSSRSQIQRFSLAPIQLAHSSPFAAAVQRASGDRARPLQAPNPLVGLAPVLSLSKGSLEGDTRSKNMFVWLLCCSSSASTEFIEGSEKSCPEHRRRAPAVGPEIFSGLKSALPGDLNSPP